MLKIRRPLGRLIFNMGIAIPGKTVFLIETAPRLFFIEQYPSVAMLDFDAIRLSSYTNNHVHAVIRTDTHTPFLNKKKKKHPRPILTFKLFSI